MPSLIRFFFGSAALPLGTASAADEATKAVEVRKVRRLSCINPLLLHDASHVSGNGVPAAIAFKEHIGESVLAAGVFAQAAIDRIVARDWMLTDPEGALITKGQADADLNSGALKFESFKLDAMTVRVYGDTAVVHGLETE